MAHPAPVQSMRCHCILTMACSRDVESLEQYRNRALDCHRRSVWDFDLPSAQFSVSYHAMMHSVRQKEYNDDWNGKKGISTWFTSLCRNIEICFLPIPYLINDPPQFQLICDRSSCCQPIAAICGNSPCSVFVPPTMKPPLLDLAHFDFCIVRFSGLDSDSVVT